MADITRGMIIMYNGEPHVIIEKVFYSPAKGASFHKVRLKNIKTGKVVSDVFKFAQKVDEIEVQKRTMQFLYADDSSAYFMDPETFDQSTISLEMIPGGTDYLHTEAKYIMSFYEDKVIFVQLPAKMTLSVTETQDAVKGNTVNNATKEAVLETGAKVQVPMFIKNGDKIIVNTDTGTYFSKE